MARTNAFPYSSSHHTYNTTAHGSWGQVHDSPLPPPTFTASPPIPLSKPGKPLLGDNPPPQATKLQLHSDNTHSLNPLSSIFFLITALYKFITKPSCPSCVWTLHRLHPPNPPLVDLTPHNPGGCRTTHPSANSNLDPRLYRINLWWSFQLFILFYNFPITARPPPLTGGIIADL